jgi:hypothetical protein
VRPRPPAPPASPTARDRPGSRRHAPVQRKCRSWPGDQDRPGSPTPPRRGRTGSQTAAVAGHRSAPSGRCPARTTSAAVQQSAAEDRWARTRQGRRSRWVRPLAPPCPKPPPAQSRWQPAGPAAPVDAVTAEGAGQSPRPPARARRQPSRGAATGRAYRPRPDLRCPAPHHRHQRSICAYDHTPDSRRHGGDDHRRPEPDSRTG